MTHTDSDIIFEETQRFKQPWLWIVILAACLPSVVILSYGLYQQLYLARPWGSHPVSDRALVIIAVLGYILGLGIPLLFWRCSLSVRVEGTNLYVHFFPFLRKRISLSDVVRHEVRAYQPLGEYGGWGIRWSWSGKGWAYNVSGDRGVQLELADGKRLLIGSQRPEQLAEAITKSKIA